MPKVGEIMLFLVVKGFKKGREVFFFFSDSCLENITESQEWRQRSQLGGH